MKFLCLTSLQSRCSHRRFFALRRPVVHWLTQNPKPTARFVAEGLRALRRIIRSRRRLMKLAPELYDEGYRDHLEKERREEEARRAEWEPILRKVYGDAAETDAQRAEAHSQSAGENQSAPGANTNRCKKGATMVQNVGAARSPRRTARQKERIAFYVAERDLAMRMMDESFARVRRRRIFPLISFSLICGLLDGAITLKRLVSGLETNFKPDETIPLRNFEEDLKRAYGAREEQTQPL